MNMVLKKQLSGQSGVCIKQIEVILIGHTIAGVNFIGGCDGQGKTLNALVTGMNIDTIISKLKDIHCGTRQTSCSAELAKFLMEIREGMKE